VSTVPQAIDLSEPGTSSGPDEVETQLELQRRILETLAAREREVRELRHKLEEFEGSGERVAAGSLNAAVILPALETECARLRELWLTARERLTELEERLCHAGTDSAPRARSRTTRLPDPARGWDSRAADEVTRAPGSLAACTIIGRNYLAQACALFESLRRHEPTTRLYLLVVDAGPEDVDPGPGVTVVDPRRLAVPDFAEMSFKYDVVEFNTAVKPYFLSLLMREHGEELVVYFDPDIIVMRRLEELRAALADASIVLTPHITRPIPSDGLTPSEQDIMVSGAYNLGFIGLRGTEESLRFLRWWEERLADGCRIDVPNGLFTDQKWIDLVPGLFPDTRILRDPTYNVAFWNLHEREVEQSGADYLVNGRPAAFFHISGFDPQAPDQLSKHQTRMKVEPGSGLDSLLRNYAEQLLDHGWRESSAVEYGFARFENGATIHPLLRKLYLQLGSEGRSAFADPFRAGGPGTFLEWATTPRPEHAGLSYFLQEVYRARIDLQEAFPDVKGRDRDGFVTWARIQGPVEMEYGPELVRLPEEGAEVGVAPAEPTTEGSEGSVLEWPDALRATPRHYDGLVDRIREIVDESLPQGATVAVVSRGDYRLMHLGGRQAWHFPRAENGLYAGFHPRESRDAIEHLKTLREAGADFLLFPETSLWWLDFYNEFRVYLDGRYAVAVEHPEACLIYDLRDRAVPEKGALGRAMARDERRVT
jgi:hypothetical protein